MNLHAMVFGPAYLDRVLRVDRPLVDAGLCWGLPSIRAWTGLSGFAGGPSRAGRSRRLYNRDRFTSGLARPFRPDRSGAGNRQGAHGTAGCRRSELDR